MLNDLSRQTRLAVFFQILGPTLMFGSIFAIETGFDAVVIGLLGFGVLVSLGWTVGFVVWNRRVDRRFKQAIARDSEDIVRGTVEPVPAVGRVVRRRTARLSPAFLFGSPGGLPPPAVVLVMTALTEDGARRVAALVPAQIGLSRKAPVAVRLHPVEREIAVLDPGVTPGQLADIAADPRWRTEKLPTDRQVVGGYSMLVAIALLATGTGLAFDWLVVALLR